MGVRGSLNVRVTRPPAMDAIQSAIDALKSAACNGKHGKKTLDTIDHIASVLLSLIRDSSSYSPQSIKKLSLILRRPLIPFYVTFTEIALRLASAIFIAIFQEKISPAVDIKDEAERDSWEGTQSELLSGILDFLEAHDTVQNKQWIADVMFSPLCSIMFPLSRFSSVFQTKTALKSVAYTLLQESAASHGPNQQKLRDAQLLGGTRLGIALSQTTDFLALESLLTLFARLLPSTQGNAVSGKTKRSKFIQAVVDAMSSEGVAQADDLARVLESISSNAWEEALTKIIDIFASNISFPQPFRLDSFHACNTIFPQPSPDDRLYVDQKAFCANVSQGDACETFQAPYSQVTEIKLSRKSGPGHQETTEVKVSLSSAPFIGDLAIKVANGGQPMALAFDLPNKDLRRFLRALRDRGMSAIIKRGQEKCSKSDSLTNLDFDAASQRAPLPSTQDKVEKVERLIDDGDNRPPSNDPKVDDELPRNAAAPKPARRPVGDMDTLPSPPSLIPTTDAPEYANLSVLAEPNPRVEVSTKTSLGQSPERDSHFRAPPTPKKQNTTSARSIAIDSDPPSPEFVPLKPKPWTRGKSQKKLVVLDSDSEGDVGGPNPQEHELRGHSTVANKSVSACPRSGLILTDELSSISSISSESQENTLFSLSVGAVTVKASGPEIFTDSPHDGYPARHNKELKGVRPKKLSSDGPAPLSAIDEISPVISPPILHDTLSAVDDRLPQNAALDARNDADDSYNAVNSNACPGDSDNGRRSKRLANVHMNDDGQATKRKRLLDANPNATRSATTGGLDADIPSAKRLRQQTLNQENDSLPIAGQPTASGAHLGDAAEAALLRKTEGDRSSPTPTVSAPQDSIVGPVPRNVLSRSEINAQHTLDEDLNKSGRNAGRNRASAMKRRGGKTNSVFKPAPKVKFKRSAALPSKPIIETTGPDQLSLKVQTQTKMRDVPSVNRKETSSDVPEPIQHNRSSANSFQEQGPNIRANESHHQAKLAPWETSAFIKAIDKTQVHERNTENDDPADAIHFDQGQVNDEKSPQAPQHDATPRRDIVMIDLTSPPDMKAISHDEYILASEDEQSEPAHLHSLPPTALRDRTKLMPLALPKGRQPRHSVTFAARESPSTIILPSEAKNRSYRLASEFLRPDSSGLFAPPTLRKGFIKRRHVVDVADKEDNDELHLYKNDSQQAGIQEIVEVLNEINKAIVRKVTRKFEGVQSSVLHGRNRILQEAAADMHEMYTESANHYNVLVDLEQEYAACGSKLVCGLEDVYRTSQNIDRQLQRIIQDHDRHTLSKKFPSSLFSSPPSALFSKVNLR